MRRPATAAAAIMLALMSVSHANAQPPAGIADQREAIHHHLQTRDYETAAIHLDAWLAVHPDDGEMLFHAARARAQLDDLEEADRLLMASLKSGFHRFSVMKRDPLLMPLRDRSTFRAIMHARDVSDDLFAARRNQAWRERLDPNRYHLARDGLRRLDFYTDLDADSLDRLQAHLARLIDFLTDSLFESLPDHRLLIVTPDAVDAREWLPDPHVPGIYRHGRRELITADFGRALQHEMVHALHHSHMDRLGQEHPIWVQEGLASLFEAYDVTDGGVIELRANERHALARTLVANGEATPWRTLFSLQDAEFHDRPAERYAQVRSIFEYLADHGRLGEWYTAYIEGFRDDPTGARALEIALGRHSTEIENDWQRWELDRSPRYASSPAGVEVARIVPTLSSPAPRTAQTVSEPHRRAETLYARIRPHRLDEYERSIPFLREVIAIDPSHAAAHYDLGLAHVVAGDRKAAERERVFLTRLDPNLASLLGSLLSE